MSSPFLIALPSGLVAAGVPVWAARVANELSKRGRAVGIILHRAEDRPLGMELNPRIAVFDLASVQPLANADGDLSPYIAAYQQAAEQLATRAGTPVVACPTLLGDCFGLFAALSRRSPDSLRVLGVCHSSIPYDAHVLSHFEPLVSRFVAVSDHLAAVLRTRMPARASDVVCVPNGVDVAEQIAPRPPLLRRPLELIYTGRMDPHIKRVFALISLTDELSRRGLPHRLTLVGDGPVSFEIDAAARARPSLVRVGPLPPREVARLLSKTDVFVLPSRLEGLSLSMLEAMGAGCVPVVARTESGAAQVIRHGVNGYLVDIPKEAGDQEVGVLLADAAHMAAATGLSGVAAAAHETVRDRFSLASSVDALEQEIDAAAASPRRTWPQDRACAFTSRGMGGSVGPNGAALLGELFASLARREARIVVHGVGGHTRALRTVLEEFRGAIVAFTDDDPTNHGRELWGLPIIPPADAAKAGATDAVISSWINQDAIWSARGVYEGRGLRVHRIYAAP